ncbi:MAG: sulfotransferase [Flavobacteriales bacterium]|nr:sulfotransferase [Flavobacteriales bacterium]
MTKPNLLIIGAAKSGTTSLHNYLNQHPDIFMSAHKEPHFLINNDIGVNRIPNGIYDYDEYIDLFKEKQDYKYRGESSTMYLQFPDFTIKNIKKYLDNIKIIIMLRNPVERAFSGYQHVKRYNRMERLDFNQAIDECESRYRNNLNMTPASRYINIGLYYNMVRKFQLNFDKEIHVIIYDDFINDTKKELSKVFDFLDVDSVSIDVDKKYMVGGWQWKSGFLKSLLIKKTFLNHFIRLVFPFKRLRRFIRKKIITLLSTEVKKMDDRTRVKLQNLYTGDISKLSNLLDRDLNSWIK